MAQSPPKKRNASSTPSKRKPKPPRWQDLATYAIPELGKKGMKFQTRYGSRRGLDAPAAIVLLDSVLARHRIRYQARYLGIRDGRAVFDITIHFKHEQALRDAVQRVGVELPCY